MIGFYSPSMFFVGMALLILLASTPLFPAADKASARSYHRLLTLDGLRGLLALSVFFYHAAICHTWVQTGVWTATPSRFYNALGHAGFVVFFMITGFLFWAQLLRNAGRPSWIKLYVARLFRIAPLYYVAVACLFVTVAFTSGGALRVPPAVIALEVLSWMCCGAFSARPLNHSPDVIPLAGVVWTLQYEWAFYLSLPMLAFAARLRRAHLAVVMALLFLAQVYLHLLRSAPYKGAIGFSCLFLFGMLIASLLHHEYRLPIRGHLRSLLALGLAAGAFFSNDPSQSTWAQLLLAGFFYLVVIGSDLFGLLMLRGLLRLGDASYGIYLLQGFALAAVFHNPASRMLDAAPAVHWLLVLAAALLLAIGASLTHRLVELPGIGIGKRAGVALERLLRRRTFASLNS